MNDETVLGHVPKLMASWFTKFLNRATNIGRTVVKGKRANRGAGHGLETSSLLGGQNQNLSSKDVHRCT